MQSFNLPAIWAVITKGITHPNLFLPRICIPDIRWLNFEALQKEGFEALCFDKDNTLTLPYANQIHPQLLCTVEHCKTLFPNKILVVSNSAGSSDDLGERQTLADLPILRHGKKKPDCGGEIISHLGIPAEKIVMIGDRLSTDIVMANQLGMLSVLVRQPLGLMGDNVFARITRSLEYWWVDLRMPTTSTMSKFVLGRH